MLLTPLELTASLFLAAIIHEAGHILSLLLFRVPILGLTFRIGGAMIQTAPIAAKEELICAAAGPLASLICALFLQRFPLLGICALIQGVFNLLPLYPMDGGRILRCFCILFCLNHTVFICKAAAISSIAIIFTIFLALFLHTRDPLYLVIAFYFLIQTCQNINTPCKEHEY